MKYYVGWKKEEESREILEEGSTTVDAISLYDAKKKFLRLRLKGKFAKLSEYRMITLMKVVGGRVEEDGRKLRYLDREPEPSTEELRLMVKEAVK